MKINNERWGEISILAMAFLWSLFPVITVISYNTTSPLTSLAWSTLFATVFFAAIMGIKKKWHELKNTAALKDILWVSLILGIAYYFFYYFALRHTSPGNAGLIALTEVFFSFLFFQIWRKDYFPAWHIFGSILVLVGAVIILLPNFKEFRPGDILILIASFIAPFGNFFQKSARQKVSSETILFARSLISTPFLFLLAFAFKENYLPTDFSKSLLILALNGIMLLGFSKILWVEGIHRISVTKSNALSSVSPLLTLFFAWLLLNQKPTLFQIVAFIPMFFGVIMLSKNRK